jgi:ATP-dependent exoDNAse (exonuclease V) beta subunit
MATNGLHIYRSSAGSGKTFQLVLSYLKIVVRFPNQYRNILAVTFTNKATDEMKTRIIQELSHLAHGEKTAMFGALETFYADLLAQKQLKEKFDIHKNAEKALSNILKDYSNFSVCTIESFCQKVIRAFAKELNIPLGYDIEMRQEVVMNKITDEMFLEAGKNAALTRLLQGFIEHRMDKDKSWKIDQEIKDLGNEIFKERYQKFYKEENNPDYTLEIQRFAEEIIAIRQGIERHISEIAHKALRIMRSHNIGIEDFSRKKTGVGAYFEKVSNRLDKVEDYVPNSYVQAAYDSPDNWLPKPTKTTDKSRQSVLMGVVSSELYPLLCDIIEYFYKSKRDYYTAIEAEKTIHTFGLLNDLQKKLNLYRKEQRQLIISDTNFLLRDLLQSIDTPFVYEKLGNQYQYYLMDEFQDTSEMQWENLYPLVHNAISEVEHEGNMMVGDVKQSIYRWRGGDMTLLMLKVRAKIEKDGLGALVEYKNLNNNWRTAKDIVDFNNEFFRIAPELMGEGLSEESYRKLFQLAYEEVGQIPQKNNVSGYVAAHFFQKKGNKVSEWKAEAMTKTLEIILQAEADGFPKSAITLLVRGNKDASLLAGYLQDNDVKVTSSESLLLENHPAVKMLISLLYYLQDGRDSLSGSTAGYYYYRFQQQAERKNAEKIEKAAVSPSDAPDASTPFPLTEEKNEIDEYLIEIFEDTGKYKLPEMLETKRTHLLRLPLYECVEQLLRISQELMKPNAYIQGFLDAVLEYNSKNDGGISGFLEWWEEVKGKKYVVSPPDSDAVQIMTVHKSKGLEFPIVIMPFCDWDLEPKVGSILWTEPQAEPYNQVRMFPVRYSNRLEETHFFEDFMEEKVMSYLDNLNILYVALTRPEYRLYLLCPFAERKNEAIAIRPKISTAGELINWILQHEIGGESWNEAGNYFEYGAKLTYSEILAKETRKKHAPKANEETEDVAPDLLEDWGDVIKIRTHAHRFSYKQRFEQDEKKAIGNLIHAALQLVKTPKDVAQAIEVLCENGEIPTEQKTDFLQRLNLIISHQEAADWFSPRWKVKTEMEIISERGKILRPDRIIFSGNEVCIIDYKTGAPHEKDVLQIKSYLKAMKKMNYAEVKGFLYYLGEGRIEEVSLS